MDILLEELLQQVKDRVTVLDGENPVMRITDAIRLAEREKLLYRYAQNGSTYEVRWSAFEHPIMYMESELPLLICKKIVSAFPSKKTTKENKATPILDTETIPTPKIATPKSTSSATSKSKGTKTNPARPAK